MGFKQYQNAVLIETMPLNTKRRVGIMKKNVEDVLKVQAQVKHCLTCENCGPKRLAWLRGEPVEIDQGNPLAQLIARLRDHGLSAVGITEPEEKPTKPSYH